MIIPLIQYGPALVGLLLAVGESLAFRRSRASMPLPVSISTALGILIALACVIFFSAWPVFPQWVPPLGENALLALQLLEYLAPLILTAVALIFLIVPVPSRGPQGSAELAPRTVLTFASRRWLNSVIGVTMVVVAVSIFAGSLSHPDDAGRFVTYEMKTSDGSGSSTNIYGWWFSVPCMIVIAIILAIALLALFLISRPALARDPRGDALARRARIRNVLAVVNGGLLLHLGVILQSLYGTSTLRTGLDAGQIGFVRWGTSFAAIGPALYVASFVTVILGMALWWFALLSVVPSHTRQPTTPVLT